MKTESQKSADDKGESRMKRYEKNKEKAAEKETVEKDDTVRSVTFYQKINDGDWEKKEYLIKIKE